MLLDRFRQGDRVAAHEVALKVLAIAEQRAQLTWNESDHEDAVQQIALDVITQLKRESGNRPKNPEKLDSWIGTIAWHSRNRFWRQVGARRKREPLMADPRRATMRDEEKDDELVELRSALAPAVRQLPKVQQQALFLRHFRNERVKDIAELLGRTENTVSSDLRRAYERLREDPGLQQWAGQNLEVLAR